MTAIELICIICKKPFWSSGFDHTCYECACKQPSKAWSSEDNKDIVEVKDDQRHKGND